MHPNAQDHIAQFRSDVPPHIMFSGQIREKLKLGIGHHVIGIDNFEETSFVISSDFITATNSAEELASSPKLIVD